VKTHTLEQILAIHEAVLANLGGAEGVRDLGSVEAAVQRMHAGMRNVEFFPTLHEKTGALLQALVQNHGFVDGNKRTALAAAMGMLDLNGYDFDFDYDEALDFMIAVATHEIDFDGIVEWLRQHSEERAD
jgi:death on curing protein